MGILEQYPTIYFYECMKKDERKGKKKNMKINKKSKK
jgi:hypothetical protein